MIPYQKELEDILIKLRPDWMYSNEDWEEYKDLLFKATGLSIEGLSDNIQNGIKNGYSLEFQLKLINDLLNSHFKN